MQICEHHVTFIYPFKHFLDRNLAPGGAVDPSQEAAQDWRTHMKTLGARWKPWWTRKSGDDLNIALDDTYFFLPYVRDLLYPETKAPHLESGLGEDAETVRQRVSDLIALPMEEWANRIGANGVQRMTLDVDATLGFREVTLRQEFHGGGEMRAQGALQWVDVLLFPQRVGFLLLRMTLSMNPLATSTTNALGDLIYLARTIHPPNLDFRLPTWHARVGEADIEFRGKDLMEYLVGGMARGSGIISGGFATALPALRAKPGGMRYYNTPDGQILGESMKWMVYSCLDRGIRGWNKTDDALPQKTFATPGDWQAWELSSLMPIQMPENRPRFEEVAGSLAPLQFRKWENWSGLAQHESVAIVGEERGRWTEETLPAIVDADYLPLYVLALYQYIRLSALAGEIQSQHADLSKDREQTNRYLTEFFKFQNFYWFTEPTGRAQGIDLYRIYHRALGLPLLFDSIRQELTDLNEFYESETARRTEAALVRIQHLGFWVAGIGLLLSALSVFFSFLQWRTPPESHPLVINLAPPPPPSIVVNGQGQTPLSPKIGKPVNKR